MRKKNLRKIYEWHCLAFNLDHVWCEDETYGSYCVLCKKKKLKKGGKK